MVDIQKKHLFQPVSRREKFQSHPLLSRQHSPQSMMWKLLARLLIIVLIPIIIPVTIVIAVVVGVVAIVVRVILAVVTAVVALMTLEVVIPTLVRRLHAAAISKRKENKMDA